MITILKLVFYCLLTMIFLSCSHSDNLSEEESKEDSSLIRLCPDDKHPHKVDLGLPSGMKWACCNVGASKPEEYGGYYAWGETEEKDSYYWENYRYYDNSAEQYIDIGDDFAGTEYDVAHVKWGNSWKMPSINQFMELMENSTRIGIHQNGVNGILVSGRNGHSIFMPAAGDRYLDYDNDRLLCGSYWSSSIGYPMWTFASELRFYLGSWELTYSDRIIGNSVRAVCP